MKKSFFDTFLIPCISAVSYVKFSIAVNLSCQSKRIVEHQNDSPIKQIDFSAFIKISEV